MSSVVVLIGGGHAAGKKTTAHLLKQEIETAILNGIHVELIDLSVYEEKSAKSSTIDLATAKSSAITVNKNARYVPLKPSRFKFNQLKADLAEKLKPSDDKTQKIFIIHGLYGLYDKELRELSQIKVFIDSDPDTRLIRWIRRDIINSEHPVGLEVVINSYLHGARSEMNDFIFPTKEFADVIMPRGAEANAVKLIFDGILAYLEDKHLIHSDRMIKSGHLRPTNFNTEKFDAQKNNFYALN